MQLVTGSGLGLALRPMPTRPCPHCRKPAPRHLPHSSEQALVNYYRCDDCGHVFAIEKGQPDGPHHPVTVVGHGERGGSSATS